MFDTICQIFGILGAVCAVTIFIGYWLGTDYYFKLSEDVIKSLLICNGLALLFTVFGYGCGIIANKLDLSRSIALYSFGMLNALFIVVFGAVEGYEGFHKSREYFWKKRGKL